MQVKGIIKKGEYYDSVTLMRVAKLLSEQKEVLDSAVVMATIENKKILQSAGLVFSELEKASDNDLVIVVKASEAKILDDVVSLALQELKSKKKSDGVHYNPKSFEAALQQLPNANLALISVAGRYAGDEAMRALERGLHVMLFSDNVSVEKEIELKKYASSKGLIVMGPDCGTAIINGVPLAFANNVRRGHIGIVAASGTGLQEVSTIISNMGLGVSQAIGTGGRDVKESVGGISFIQGLRALMLDSSTKVILLVSKPPHKSVLEKIIQEIKKSKYEKPVVACFLGAEEKEFSESLIIPARTLEEAAQKAVYLAQGRSLTEVEGHIRKADENLDHIADQEVRKLSKGQKYIRGLFTGGTFVSEAQILINGLVTKVYSNAPTTSSKKLEDNLKSKGNTFIDFGEDEFTVGRPHPMIDFTLRNKRILEEAKDPEVALLLMDLVLGWGANMDPLAELIPVIVEARKIVHDNGRYLPIIMSVTGTDMDPQGRAKVIEALKDVGVYVASSNAAASKLAIKIAERMVS